MQRNSSLDDLIRSIPYDSRHSTKSYINSAKNFLSKGNTYLSRGDTELENALLYLHQVADIMVKIIPKCKDLPDLLKRDTLLRKDYESLTMQTKKLFVDDTLAKLTVKVKAMRLAETERSALNITNTNDLSTKNMYENNINHPPNSLPVRKPSNATVSDFSTIRKPMPSTSKPSAIVKTSQEYLSSRQKEPPKSAIYFMNTHISARVPQNANYSNYSKIDDPLKSASRSIPFNSTTNDIDQLSKQKQKRHSNSNADAIADLFYKFGSNNDSYLSTSTQQRETFNYPIATPQQSATSTIVKSKAQNVKSPTTYHDSVNRPLPPLSDENEVAKSSFDDLNRRMSELSSFQPPTPPRPVLDKAIVPPPIPSKLTPSENSNRSPLLSSKQAPRLNSNKRPPPLPKKPSTAVNVNHPGRFPLLNDGADQAGFSSVAMLGDMGGGGIAGLRNLGNTCFLNSTLQCLISTTPLIRLFMTGAFRKDINKYNKLGYGGRLALAFDDIIRQMWKEQYSVVHPGQFKEMVGQLSKQFQGNEQQDSQEFLSFLLDGLHEDLNVSAQLSSDKENFIESDDDNDDKENISETLASHQAWQMYRMKNSSIIVDLFQGQLRSRLQCQECQKTSSTYNAFMYLTVSIPQEKRRLLNSGVEGVTVYDCLHEFFNDEHLDGNAWKCPRCKMARPATKKLSISKTPAILMIHLKRFSYQGPFRDKLDTYVDFPLRELNLDCYMSQPNDEMATCTHGGTTYDLYGVSNHFGGLNGGHYTAQCLNQHRHKWHNFDDSRISGCEAEDVKSKAAYILYYMRRNLS